MSICGGLVQIVLIESVRESLVFAAARESAIHTGRAIGEDTAAVIALCRITDVVELSCYAVGTEIRFGDASKILYHALANGVVRTGG